MKEGDLIAGRYRLERRAGVGGMGTVFRAIDGESRRIVALKTLSAQPLGDSEQSSGTRLNERFEREASALAAVSSAGIVRYIAHGVSESGEPYLVMHWVEGQDLASRLNDRGVSTSEALRLGIRLCEALEALHADGIVHRDVKPANVMLEHGQADRAVLVDLGVARRVGIASATMTGARVGTPSYMAPEQIRDPRRVDGRADVFSLGCILFECLSGRRAFDAEDGLGAIAKILLERAPSLTLLRPELPPEVSALVASMLEREPGRRPYANAALSAALLQALVESSENDLPPPRLAQTAAATQTEIFGTRAEVAGQKHVQAPANARRPRPKGALIGRERELGELRAAFATGARGAWLWGAPGIGKTRLSLELCTQSSDDSLPSTTLFVELGAALDRNDAVRVLAQRIGARVRGPEAATQAIARALAARGPALLVLDAVDRVFDALEPLLDELSGSAPQTRLLITSRERPQLHSLVSLEVAPLPVRAERELAALAPLDLSPAAQLFVQCLREHGQAAPRTLDERVGVERIARELDGVPLALELVAARVPLLGLTRVEADVAQRPSRVGDARLSIVSQVRTSFETLTASEREVLLACATFVGSFTEEAVQALLGPDSNGGAALEALQRLREKSLVFVAGDDFALLRPVRDFAVAELSREGLQSAFADRHEDYQARRVGELLRLREVEGARRTLERLEREADDVLAALEHALRRGEPEAEFVLTALVALDPLMAARGPLPAFMAILNRCVAAVDSGLIGGSPELLARVLLLRGRLRTTSGAFAAAKEDLLRAKGLAEGLGGAELLAVIFLEIGVNHHFQRELADARSCYLRALELCPSARQDVVRGRCYGNLGAVLHDEGRLTEAAAHYWKAIRVLEERGEARELGNFLSNLAVLEQELGARADARRHYQRAISLLGELAEARLQAIAIGNLGVLESEEGDWPAARRCHEQALELLRTQNDVFSEALCRARLGAALAMLECEAEANEQLSVARRLIADADPARIAAVRLQRAFLDLAHAERALREQERSEAEQRFALAEAICSEVSSERVDGVALTALSDDVRATLRALGPLLSDARRRFEA